MHDIRAIRENPSAFDAALARRALDGASSEILSIDEARRAAIHAAETAQAVQNKASKAVCGVFSEPCKPDPCAKEVYSMPIYPNRCGGDPGIGRGGTGAFGR